MLTSWWSLCWAWHGEFILKFLSSDTFERNAKFTRLFYKYNGLWRSFIAAIFLIQPFSREGGKNVLPVLPLDTRAYACIGGYEDVQVARNKTGSCNHQLAVVPCSWKRTLPSRSRVADESRQIFCGQGKGWLQGFKVEDSLNWPVLLYKHLSLPGIEFFTAWSTYKLYPESFWLNPESFLKKLVFFWLNSVTFWLNPDFSWLKYSF